MFEYHRAVFRQLELLITCFLEITFKGGSEVRGGIAEEIFVNVE